MSAPDLLERIDRIAAELAELRAEVAGLFHGVPNLPDDADDLAADNLIDTHSAQERFGFPRNTLAKWCRTEDLGVLQGGRWLISIPRLRRRLNGK